MKIAVSNPGVHPEVAVVAAHLGRSAGVELTYYTSGSLAADSRLLAVANGLLPAGSAPLRDMGRRRLPEGLDRAHVVQLGSGHELLYLGLRRRHPLLATRVMRRRTRVFDRRLARILRARPPDVLIAQSAGVSCALQAGRDSGATTILNAPIAHPVTAVRILRDEAARNPEWAGTFPLPDVLQGRSEARFADYIFGAGNFTRSAYVEEAGFDGTRFRSIPLGVDTNLFTPGRREPDGVFRVIFVGQLTQRKGLKYLIDAVDRLDLPKKELLLVGPPVGDVLSVLPSHPWLRVLNSVPRARLAQLYRSSDAFVLPSLVEGFAQTPLEAMACGIPVIITPNMGVADIVTAGVDAEVVPIQDAAAITSVLDGWAADEARRAAVGASARRTAAIYTWQEFARRYAADVVDCVAGSDH